MGSVAAYVDGFNLYFSMRAAYRRKYLWLDVVDLVQRLRPKDSIAVVWYFSAMVRGNPAAAANQLEYLQALRAHNDEILQIRLGRFMEKTIKPCGWCGRDYLCGCQRPYRTYEEKETDVALGAMMVADAALGIGDTTLLISADSDLVPAVEAIRRVNRDRSVYLAMPPANMRPSARFCRIGHFHIRESVLRAAQLPPIVADTASGRFYTRPAKWS